MKRAKRLVPRLLAVGVILGMGAISIVQGIPKATTDPSEANQADTAAPPESAAQPAHVLTPVASIGLNDAQLYDDTPSNSRFSQNAEDGVDDVASAVISQFDRARDQTVIPQITHDEDTIGASLPLQAGHSRFSKAPLPVEILDDVAAEPQDTEAEYEPPVDALATDVSDPVGLADQNEFPRDGMAERVNHLRSDQSSSRFDALPHREPKNSTLPLSSIPLATETEEATPANDTFEPLPIDEPRNHVVTAASTEREDLTTGPHSASPDDATATAPFSVATTSPRADEADSQRGGPPPYAAVNLSTAPPQNYEGESTSTTNQRDLSSFLPTEPETRATDSTGGIPNLAQDAVVDSLGKPGARILEGPQTPSLTIEKRAPPEIQMGKMAEFSLTVRNVGKVSASGLVIQDEVPEGTRFVGAEPEISATQGSTLYWELDTLAPGDELTVTMRLMPEAEGEIGSVGVVTFRAEASVRTIATRPLLMLEQTVPERVHIGDVVQVKIRVWNPGNGAATSVVLEEDVPNGLSHPAGSSLERELGTIRPNESREVELTLTADKPGIIDHVVVARADANLVAEDRAQIEVVAPDLQVGLRGPAKRYLERQATYALSVENHGTASARNIELIAHLPKGMKFVETNNAGQYDPRSHAVYWSLEELPAEQSGEVQLVTLPIEPGEQKLRFEGYADMGLNDSLEKTIRVDGLPSLFFEVADTADPIEVGKETTYEVRLVNEGSKEATEISLQAELSPGLKPLDANGPERSQVNGQQITFPPLARVAPGADVYFKIRAEGIAAGQQLIRVQVKSREMQIAVIEEENTLVYSDQ